MAVLCIWSALWAPWGSNCRRDGLSFAWAVLVWNVGCRLHWEERQEQQEEHENEGHWEEEEEQQGGKRSNKTRQSGRRTKSTNPKKVLGWGGGSQNVEGDLLTIG